MKHKLVGEVISLSGRFVGLYMVRLYRYPTGRTLPEPRLIVEDGKPFTSRLKALETLGAYTRGELVLPRSPVKLDHPVANEHPVTGEVLKVLPRTTTPHKRVRAHRPPVVKMPEPTTLGSAGRALTRMQRHAELNALVMKVTRYDEDPRTDLSRRQTGARYPFKHCEGWKKGS